ncbi:protein C2-DOMAIN ABA-RELATED 3 isoform X2 [Cryptomeria japonica]|uniref:protein C2-DOMAIN ABA-RELATED 3 isoform X2 n=1 Tax=Cryptomeria japonica TaxID=3369 RepID=UPI0025ACE0CD|nr:protein C2-DOMAIN ABA-RELATED 3 isoform X2 [Cryptomeria japonica]
MENMLGLLKVRVVKATNLAIRDLKSSDPYVVLTLGNQQVLDKDTLSKDDKMGDAEIDLQPLVTSVNMRNNPQSVNSDTELRRLVASKDNCLGKDSCIRHVSGQTIQDLCLRLQNVESGELEVEIRWIDLPQAT